MLCFQGASHQKLSASGLESSPDFPQISTELDESGAQSGALRAPSAIPADGETAVDPLLRRFLDAWDQLSDADRLRLADEAERLAAGP